jgi:hypothetical protein
MSLLKFQAGVQVPWVCYIAAATVNAANVLGLKVDMLVTSGNDKVHARGSKHYTDEALDFRTKHLKSADKLALRNAVKQRLGREFDVILEDEGGNNEHLHVEHDPKK